MNNDIDIIEPETTQYGGKDSISFKEISLRHLARITNLSCVEFRGGYFEEKPILKGGVSYITKVYVSDSRDVYSNAIDCLHDLLLPKFDTKIKQKLKDIEKELNGIRNKEKDFQNFMTERVKIKRKLFQELCLLLDRLNYLASEEVRE
jgi:hypothetical protein